MTASSHNVKCGKRVRFVYNGSVRTGEVVAIDKRLLTLKHDDPAQCKGKQFSSYSFDKIATDIVFNN